MFPNEVLIDKIEKEKLVELATEANKMLEKYEYSSDYSHHFTQDIDYHRVLKQIKVEVAKEIFDEIDNIIYNLRDSPFYSSSDAVYELTELKKKYTGE